MGHLLHVLINDVYRKYVQWYEAKKWANFTFFYLQNAFWVYFNGEIKQIKARLISIFYQGLIWHILIIF